MTDEESFSWMEPTSDGFRNFVGKADRLPAEYLLVHRANLLTLSAPEMTVLVGGMRAMGTNHGGSTQRRAHRAPKAADQLLLLEPARHEHHLGARGGRLLRAPRRRGPGRGHR